MKIYLVDFENVKSKGLTGIDSLDENDKVIIFYSENSDTISFEMHQKVLLSRAQIQYLKVNVGGKNALDFQLATLLGYLVGRDEYSHIFVISNDKGFDFLHDFWQAKFEPTPDCIVYRTRTITAAVNFAQAGKTDEPTEDNVQEDLTEATSVPETEEDPTDDETSEAETYEPQAESSAEILENTEETVTEQPEEAPASEPVQEEVQKIVQQEQQTEQAPADKKPAKTKKKRPVTYIENLAAALKSAKCSEEEISDIAQMLAVSTTKEEFHNLLAKEFKAIATDYYKLLRPKYLRLKELYEAENPSEKPANEVQPQEEIREEKPIFHDVISARLAELLAGLCSDDELKIIDELFRTVSTKQQLYIRMVKAFKKEKGCQFYNAVREEYVNLHK